METALEIVDQAKALTVHSAEDNSKAAELCKLCKAFQAEIKSSYEPIVKKAHEAHKAAVAELNAQLKPYEEAEKVLKRVMIDWATAERERIAQARRDAEAKARKEAEEATLAEAEFLAASGDAKAADAVLEAPIIAKPVEVKVAEKAAGTSIREVWKARVVDIKALCRAVADGVVPPEFVEPNLSALSTAARSMKHLLGVPGVEAYAEQVMGVSR